MLFCMNQIHSYPEKVYFRAGRLFGFVESTREEKRERGGGERDGCRFMVS